MYVYRSTQQIDQRLNFSFEGKYIYKAQNFSVSRDFKVIYPLKMQSRHLTDVWQFANKSHISAFLITMSQQNGLLWEYPLSHWVINSESLAHLYFFSPISIEPTTELYSHNVCPIISWITEFIGITNSIMAWGLLPDVDFLTFFPDPKWVI